MTLLVQKKKNKKQFRKNWSALLKAKGSPVTGDRMKTQSFFSSVFTGKVYSRGLCIPSWVRKERNSQQWERYRLGAT